MKRKLNGYKMEEIKYFFLFFYFFFAIVNVMLKHNDATIIWKTTRSQIGRKKYFFVVAGTSENTRSFLLQLFFIKQRNICGC